MKCEHISFTMSCQTRRVSIMQNGVKGDAQTILMPETDDQFYTIVKMLLPTAQGNIRLFLEDGTELSNPTYIRNNDKLFVSNGEDFMSLKALEECDEWVTLNVGGKYFTTSRRTLTMSEPESMLARMFSQDNTFFSPSCRDKNGAYLIDRSPKYFEPILNYLRCGELVYDKHINPEGILAEATFFGIISIIPTLEGILQTSRKSRDETPLTRRDVVNTLINSSVAQTLRFQGVNLAGANLSKLDLRAINFKYANLQGCNLAGANLSWCCLERADLSHAVLDSAQLQGVRGLRAILEGASMRNCNFKDPGGKSANLEGANLKGACLEDSDMGGINLRIANCKNANLKNCDLRAAVLAGADLENCDLSGSDLHEANLRGANLKDAAFELMLTPLHMSQTIR